MFEVALYSITREVDRSIVAALNKKRFRVAKSKPSHIAEHRSTSASFWNTSWRERLTLSFRSDHFRVNY